MHYSEPLAKSGIDKPILLSEHLRQVAEYANQLIEAYYTHWRSLLGDEWAAHIKDALILAGKTHDLGKAAEGFQRALNSAFHWEFRHEVLSAALLLADAPKDDKARWLAIAAVLTHHRSLDDPQLRRATCLSHDDKINQKLVDNFKNKAKEMEVYWEWLHQWIHTEGIPIHLPQTPAQLQPPDKFLEELRQKVEGERRQKGNGLFSKQNLALLLTRGGLLAADHAVSAGVDEFKARLPEPDLPPLRRFQEEVGNAEGHAFLEAPTGSGKTNAALLWALRNRRGGERIFYLLPYQASIEAMADTLKTKFGEEHVGVLHSRALDYAFQDYFEKIGEYQVAYHKAKSEVDINRLVHKPIKVATPFQLLKWLFGIPRFEIGVSEMVGGLFIFDEIHAYDAHVVALICEMVSVLSRLGGRFLFMSATFPPFLKELLRSAIGHSIGEFSVQQSIAQDGWAKQFLSQPRHHLVWHNDTLESLIPSVIDAARSGQRVLLIANRVAQAQAIYRTLREQIEGVHLLHSRFARRDRVQKEQAILQALKDRRSSEVRVLVATQVVEVSLDVSFDTLFTEVAPVDDLLQRFGRVNRYGEHPDGVKVHVATVYDANALQNIYDLDRVKATCSNAPAQCTPLNAEVASEWVQGVYGNGWTPKERQRFESARKAFGNVLKSLCPLMEMGTGKEDFEGLFQGKELLPCCLLEEYDTYLRDKQYLLASQMLVPVPVPTFQRLRNARRLEDSKQTPGVYVANVAYNSEIGLHDDTRCPSPTLPVHGEGNAPPNPPRTRGGT